MPLDIRMGDVLEMRKPHPCGGRTWSVVRVGADIGLLCDTCRRRILMDRPTVFRRVKRLIERGAPLDPAIEAALFGTPAAPGEHPSPSE
jgi:hypothetical protein